MDVPMFLRSAFSVSDLTGSVTVYASLPSYVVTLSYMLYLVS